MGCKHSTANGDLSKRRMSLITKLGFTPTRQKLHEVYAAKQHELSCVEAQTRSSMTPELRTQITGLKYQIEILETSITPSSRSVCRQPSSLSKRTMGSTISKRVSL